MGSTILTLGHSSHSWVDFLSLLDRAGAGAIVDVRSRPWSRLPHFRRPELRARLNANGYPYVHLGDALGGMPAAGPTTYTDMARAPTFAAGIDELLTIAGRCRPVVLCAEHDPLVCHRFLLVARYLTEHCGVETAHILSDGRIETQEQTEDRLLTMWEGGGDLLRTRSESLTVAYRLQEKKLSARA